MPEPGRDGAGLRCRRRIRFRHGRSVTSLRRTRQSCWRRDLGLLQLRAVRRPKYRIKRILREDVFDVGNEQFLMLLFVMHARASRLARFLREARRRRLRINSITHSIDRFAIAIRFRHGRARDQPAQIAPMHVASGVVIGIEEIGVLRNFGAITLHPNFHHKGLEKPGGVCEMPLRRTDVGHRLDDVILRLEIPAKPRAEIAHLPITLDQAWCVPRMPAVGRTCAWAPLLGHEVSGAFKGFSLPARALPCAPPPSDRGRPLPLHQQPAVRPDSRHPRPGRAMALDEATMFHSSTTSAFSVGFLRGVDGLRRRAIHGGPGPSPHRCILPGRVRRSAQFRARVFRLLRRGSPNPLPCTEILPAG